MAIKYRCDNCGAESPYFCMKINKQTQKQTMPRPMDWGKLADPENHLIDLCPGCTRSVLISPDPKKPPLSIVKVNGE